jgi:hypothetical protein
LRIWVHGSYIHTAAKNRKKMSPGTDVLTLIGRRGRS